MQSNKRNARTVTQKSHSMLIVLKWEKVWDFIHKRFIQWDLNSWKGPASKRDLLHPKDHANRRWTIHRAEYVQDKTRLDKSNRRYCFYTSNSFLHVGTAHFFLWWNANTNFRHPRMKSRSKSKHCHWVEDQFISTRLSIHLFVDIWIPFSNKVIL